MKQSINTDKQCITKILKYITDMKQILINDNITSFQDLKKSLSRYGITQLITNIYELTKKIQPDTLNSLKQFNTIKIRTARQIASHDYTSIDFKHIYDICLQLTDKLIYNELNTWLGVVNNENNKH